LIGYDRRGRLHVISTQDLSFSIDLSIGLGYGIKCVSDRVIGIGHSTGASVVGQGKDGLYLLGEADANGWVWDMCFSGLEDRMFFVCSVGSLQSVPVPAGSDKAPFEAPRKMEQRIELSAEYPLKGVCTNFK